MYKGKIAYHDFNTRKKFVKLSKCNQYQDVNKDVELGTNIPTNVQCRNCKSRIIIERIHFRRKGVTFFMT